MFEQIRDWKKLWTAGQTSFCLFGIENQSTIDKDMVFRVLNYDAADYNAQLRMRDEEEKFKKNLKENNKSLTTDEIRALMHKQFGTILLSEMGFKRIPVLTIVLYFGDTPWTGPFTIHDSVEYNDPELLAALPEYKITVLGMQH